MILYYIKVFIGEGISIYMEELLTLNEACSVLKITNLTIRRWRDQGIIELVRLPLGRLRVRQSEINRIINGDEPSDTPLKEEVLTLEQAIQMVFDNYVIKSHGDEEIRISDVTNIFKKEKMGFTRELIVNKLRELGAQHRFSNVSGEGTRIILLDKPKMGGEKQ